MSSDRLEYVPLSDIAEINPRKDVRLSGESTPVSFIPMGDVSESGVWENQQTRPLGKVDSGYTSFKEGDVLFAKITPCMENGKGCHARNLVNGHGFGSTEFHVLRAIEGVSDARFLYHWTRTPMLRLKAESAMSGSAGQQRVSTWFFDEFRVPRIPLPEQRRIADVLDTVDAAIQETDRVVEKQEQVKTGLLQDLLTRGLDADGRLRDPERESEAFRETELGRRPVEWEIKQVGKLLTGITQGWSPKCHPDPAPQGQWGVLRTTSVQWGGFKEDENKALPSDLSPRPEYEVEPMDILMTRAGPASRVGVVAMVGNVRDKLLLSDKLYRLEHGNDILPGFLYAALSSEEVQGLLGREKTGMAGSQTNISQRIVKGLLLPYPPLDEQERIVSVLEEHSNRIASEDAYSEKLQCLKTGLMQDLLTGRVRVPETEDRVDEVLA